MCVSLIDDVIDNIFKKDIRNSKISKLKEDDNYDMILDQCQTLKVLINNIYNQ